MSLLGTLQKQPSERAQVGINYDCWLKGRSTLRSLDVTTEPYGSDDDSMVLFGAFITPGGDVVHLFIDDGVAGADYKLTIRATSTAGLIKEDELIVRVEDQ